MPNYARFRIHKQAAARGSVEVSERSGVRYLHLGSVTIQSAMRLARPNDLELSYTRCMLAFLLFVPPPRRVVMIGLGGGSLAKFIHVRMPDTHVTAVEINPQVVAAAHQFFGLPDASERLTVETGDGAAFVQSLAGAADVLLVDGYGTDAGAPELATAAFYEDCERALADNGVLVTNLFTGRPGLDAHLRVLARAFPGRLLHLADAQRGNLIVTAFVRGQGQPTWKALRERARGLEALYGLEFPAFVERLKERNRHDSGRLHV
jgi:spermidine synthase